MANKKKPRHILAMLICLVLVLGLNVSCGISRFYIRTFEGTFEIGSFEDFLIWMDTGPSGFNVKKTDTTGSNSETLPVPGAPEHGVVIPTENAGTSSPLRVGSAPNLPSM